MTDEDQANPFDRMIAEIKTALDLPDDEAVVFAAVEALHRHLTKGMLVIESGGLAKALSESLVYGASVALGCRARPILAPDGSVTFEETNEPVPDTPTVLAAAQAIARTVGIPGSVKH